MFRYVIEWIVTDVSGQYVGSLLDILIIEEETDALYRNFFDKLLIDARKHREDRRVHRIFYFISHVLKA